MKFRVFHRLPLYPSNSNFNYIYQLQKRRRFSSIFQKLHTTQARASFNGSSSNGSSQGLISLFITIYVFMYMHCIDYFYVFGDCWIVMLISEVFGLIMKLRVYGLVLDKLRK